MVIHTREGHRGDLSDCPPAKLPRGGKTFIGEPGPMGRILVRGEAGHDIIPELYPVAGEPVIDKPGKGAFYQTDLHLILQNHGIKTLIVCGVTTEVCVTTTVREANDRGYECIIPEDCVGSYFPEFQKYALEMIKAQGAIFGWITDSKAIIAGLDSVADMTEALARFFRYTITKVENLVSVEEELDNCETYFGIQKYRFGDRLQLHIDYDIAEYEKIMNCRIPKLTLQPILENSIIHGVELKVGGGNLYIRFQCTKDRLLIRISDDGVGMDEMTLAKLNQKLGKSTKAFHDNEEKQGGIALVNVNNRIHLIFGDEYGMHVYSVPGEGTDGEITIPILTDDRQVKNRSVLA